MIKKPRHGHCPAARQSDTHMSWTAMRARCTNPNHKHYRHYGGRGILICARWGTFAQFLADMGERPKGFTLDRIDGNGNYESENCRWASRTDQNNNRRDNHRITYGGRTQTVAQWSREIGVEEATLRHRMLRGWDVERAMTQPVQRRTVNV